MSRTIVSNDFERVQRGRAARTPARVDSVKVKKFLGLLVLILFFALIHLQIQSKISHSSSTLAMAQQDYLRLQNVQRDLTQQVAALKDPARIQRLALSMGMIPPQELKLSKVYSAPWTADRNPSIGLKEASAKTETEKISLWAKFLGFSSQAEAKSTVQ